jgi:thermitase
VAGTAAAAATDNSAGMVGICPRCRLMPVKVMDASGSGSLDQVANGITYAADNGARVINLSLGGGAGTATLQSAVDYAWNRGLVVVAAAGNNGTDSRLYPAAYPNVIAVASSERNDYHSCFSNFGTDYVSIAAPGEAIYSTTPRRGRQ